MLLTVFIDGLKPETVEYMEFINTLGYRAKIIPELGYSNACHASMYTGVHTNKHEYWFIWEFNPNTSPFKWTKFVKIPDNIFTRFLAYSTTTAIYGRKYTSFYGIHFPWDIPLEYWKFLDISEKKFWTEPRYAKYKTIFEIFQEHNVLYVTIGMGRFSGIVKSVIKSFLKIKQKKTSPLNYLNNLKGHTKWIYLFYGEIDRLSHTYGQDHEIVINRVKEIDSEVEQVVKHIQQTTHEEVDILLFSDHGHALVEEEVDLYELFKKRGYSLTKFIHVLDANYARFYFRNEKEKELVEKILEQLSDRGFILDTQTKKKYNVDVKNKNYGDLIFYLDMPFIFKKPEINIGLKTLKSMNKSMHGYLPQYEEMKGTLVTNIPIKQKEIPIVSIAPTLLEYFGIYSESAFRYMDGKPVW